MLSARLARWNLIVLSLLMVYAYFWIDPSGRSSEIFRFFGRLHPALVHFPIGIMILALLLAILKKTGWVNITDSAVNLTLLLGSWSGVKAIFAGSYLAQVGGYPVDLLFLHKIMGFGATSLCAILLVLRTAGEGALKKPVYSLLTWSAMVILLAVGGDIGGQMTHGKGYVTEYAPGFIRSFLGHPDAMATRFDLSSPGTTSVYDGIVSPIFMEKCSSCHGETRGKGKLRLHNAETITSHEGDEPLIVAGNPDESLLIKRVSLPEGHEDQMPPYLHAKPVLHADVELLRWWISSGASFDAIIAETPMPDNILTILQAYGLGELRTGVFALDLPVPDSALVASWREKGVRVNVLADGESLLSVRCRVVTDCLSGPEMEGLAGNVTWLDLRDSNLTDADLALLSGFPLLTRLNVAGTAINGAGLNALGELQHLEYLNLYDTRVDDAALDHVAAVKTITAVYLWQTAVTDGGVTRLREALPVAEINTGSSE